MAYFERFLSRRYLFNRSNRALVSVITFIAAAGVTVGVAALIIVIGVIEGIDRDIFSKIVQIQPHIKVMSAEGGVADPAPALEKMAAIKGIRRAEPVIARQVLLEAGNEREALRAPAQLLGVTGLGQETIYAIPNKNDKSTIHLGPREVLLSYDLAAQLQVMPGGQILATTGQLAKTANGWRPRMRNLKVVGLYSTGLGDFDAHSAFISAETAQEVFGLEGRTDFVEGKLTDPFDAARIKDELTAALGPGWKITTWGEENGEFFSALKLEKIGLTVVLLLVVMVASFNIVGTLILMVMEKKRQIGILKAFGAPESMVRGIFLNAGAFIGVTGAACGLVLGLFGAYAIGHWIDLGMGNPAYGFDRLPVLVKPGSVALILVSSILISLAAALFPAAQAARLDPIEALRHE